jgi:biotin operon repressor
MNKFTSLTLGEVRSPVNVLKEILDTFNRRHKCKAAILSWLDGKHYYGNEWVRITFEELGNVLGYCRETISKHIRELIKLGLLEHQASNRFPKDTACEYQINQHKLTEILGLSQCEKTDDYVPENSGICANNPSTYRNYPETSQKKQPANKNESQDAVQPDWDTLASETLVWEQNQLTRLQDVESQSTPTTVDDRMATPFADEPIKDFSTNDLTHHEDASPVPDNEKDSLTNDLISRVDASPVPDDEHEEENIKLIELRDAIGSLTPKLKRLIVDFTLGDLRSSLALYRQRHQFQQIRDSYSWLKKCLQQKWWQDKANTHPLTGARKDVPEPLAANEKLTLEQKVWYEKAINQGICLPAPIEELPIKMGLVCARVAIPNRKPYQLLFDILPIEELIVEYPL